jgi:hypothetical protein
VNCRVNVKESDAGIEIAPVSYAVVSVCHLTSSEKGVTKICPYGKDFKVQVEL